MITEWTPITQQLPEDGLIVLTRIYDDENGARNETLLKRKGKLWFYPDGFGYVYYTPTHWKDAVQPECERQSLFYDNKRRF